MYKSNSRRNRNRDINNIFKKPELDYQARDVEINIPIPHIPVETDDKTNQVRDTVIKKFEDAIEISDEIISEIDKRCEHLEITVDYENNPDLELAIMAVFGERREKLTYQDFVDISEESYKLQKHMVAERFGY